MDRGDLLVDTQGRIFHYDGSIQDGETHFTARVITANGERADLPAPDMTAPICAGSAACASRSA
jgi:hypothetical protein